MRRVISFIAVIAVAASSLAAGAQQPAATPVANPNANLPFGASSATPVSKWTPPASAGRQLTLNDLLTWKGIRSATLSNDGKWFAYILAPNEGDAEVVVKSTAAGGKETRYPIGDATAAGGAGGRGAAVAGASPSISGNNKWVAFLEYASGSTGRGGRGGRGGGGGGAGAAAAAPGSTSPKLAIVELATGTKREFESVRSFRFAGEKSDWLAVLHSAPPAAGGGGGGGRGSASDGNDARAGESDRRHTGADRRRLRVLVRQHR